MKRHVFIRAFAALAILLALPVLAPCAPQPTLNAPVSQPRVLMDVAYGTDPAQKMDVYLPSGFVGLRPGVALIHGGGWQGGDKSFYGPSGRALAALGFVAFSLNYRLTPSSRYPAQADDVQRAVRWMRAHAADYQLDPARMGALGDSAGGHLSLILGTEETRDNSDAALVGQSSRVQCVVDFYGPADLTAAVPAVPRTDGQRYVAGVLRDLLGGPPQENLALARAASPLFSVDAKSAPTLIITGTDDPLVALDQSERLADALHAAGVETVLAIIYKQGHGFLHPGDPQTYGAMSVEWLARHLRP